MSLKESSLNLFPVTFSEVRFLAELKVRPVAAVEKGLGTDGSYGSSCQGCRNSKSVAVI